MKGIKRALLLVVMMWMGASAMAQEVKYYDRWNRMVDKSTADHYEVIDLQSDGSAFVKRYKMGDTLTSESHYKDFHRTEEGKSNRHGLSRDWHPNGQLAREGNYQNNKAEGQHTSWYKGGQKRYEEFFVNGELQDTLKGYYENGQLRRLEVYEAGKMLQGEVYAKDGNILPYYPAEQMPAFPGGERKMLKYLSTNIKYPKSAIKENASGLAVASFVVGKDGVIEDIVLIKSIHPAIDAEVVRLISAMPKWKAGTQEGEAVNVQYTLPVNFSIN